MRKWLTAKPWILGTALNKHPQIFPLPEQIFIIHDSFNVFKTHMSTSNRYGLNSIPYKATQPWNLLPENLKSCPSLTLFKNEVTLWKCFNFPCNICKSYVGSGYCVLRDWFFSCILASSWYWFESCVGHT